MSWVKSLLCNHLPAFSPFPKVFSKASFLRVVKSRDSVVMSLTLSEREKMLITRIFFQGFHPIMDKFHQLTPILFFFWKMVKRHSSFQCCPKDIWMMFDQMDRKLVSIIGEKWKYYIKSEKRQMLIERRPGQKVNLWWVKIKIRLHKVFGKIWKIWYTENLNLCFIAENGFKFELNPLPNMKILGSSNSAAHKDMMSKIWTNGDTFIWLNRIHCGKRRYCSSWAISPFPTMFSKAVCCWCVKISIYGVKG